MPKLTSYSMMGHYDPAFDGEAVCLIGYTGQGAYWIRARKAPEGRLRREQKTELMARLAAAIDAGQPPGEVSIDAPRPERLNETFDPDDF